MNRLGYSDTRYTRRWSILLRVAVMLLRGFYVRLLTGCKAEGALFLGRDVELVGRLSRLRVGPMTKIEKRCVVQVDSTRGVSIGSKCTIGEGTMIRPSGYYGGNLGAGMTMGDNSAVGVNSYIGCSGFIEIGRNVIIGPHFTAIAENHLFSDDTLPIKLQGVHSLGIVICDDVWIGANVTVLDGVTIGSRCVIGAGAVVTKSIPPGSVALGVPAKVVRSI